MITLAFYHGDGLRLKDRIVDFSIRTVTGSMYSHVEIIFRNVEAGSHALCWSVSPRDRGARSKFIRLNTDHWTLVEIDADVGRALRFMKNLVDERVRYDTIGAIGAGLGLCQFGIPSRWYCSEACASSIGMHGCVTPGDMFRLVMDSPEFNARIVG
jgi:hypothetical protein